MEYTRRSRPVPTVLLRAVRASTVVAVPTALRLPAGGATVMRASNDEATGEPRREESCLGDPGEEVILARLDSAQGDGG